MIIVTNKHMEDKLKNKKAFRDEHVFAMAYAPGELAG